MKKYLHLGGRFHGQFLEVNPRLLEFSAGYERTWHPIIAVNPPDYAEVHAKIEVERCYYKSEKLQSLDGEEMIFFVAAGDDPIKYLALHLEQREAMRLAMLREAKERGEF